MIEDSWRQNLWRSGILLISQNNTCTVLFKENKRNRTVQVFYMCNALQYSGTYKMLFHVHLVGYMGNCHVAYLQRWEVSLALSFISACLIRFCSGSSQFSSGGNKQIGYNKLASKFTNSQRQACQQRTIFPTIISAVSFFFYCRLATSSTGEQVPIYSFAICNFFSQFFLVHVHKGLNHIFSAALWSVVIPCSNCSS